MTSYVMLYQGQVERTSSDTIVLDLDYLMKEPAVTDPKPVAEMQEKLVDLEREGAPVGQWIKVCKEWLEDYEEANPPFQPT